MARNRSQILQRWRPGHPPANYDQTWMQGELQSIGRAFSDLVDVCEGGPIPGQRIAYDLGPLTVDNSGGGVALTVNYAFRTGIEAACEPVFASVCGASVAGGNVIVDLNIENPTVAGVLMTRFTVVPAAPFQMMVDRASDFAVTEWTRQYVLTVNVIAAAGAVMERGCVRVVVQRCGHIPDVGTTRTLGR